MNDIFLKKRKYILIISCTLSIYQLSGITFTKINILGNETDIKNPEIVTYIILVLFIYYLLRYYQKFVELGNKGIAVKYKDILSEYFIDKNIGVEFFNRLLGVRVTKENHMLRYVKSGAFNVVPNNEEYHEWIIDRLFPIVFRCGTFDKTSDARMFFADRRSDNFYLFQINFFKSLLFNIRAFVLLSINTSLVTEYILPFVIASIPVFVFVYQHFIVKIFNL